MGRDKSHGLMEHFTRVTMSTARNMVRACSSGLMEPPTKETFWIIISMGLEPTSGRMDVSSQASGRTTRCMARVFSAGQMGASMKEIGRAHV